MTLTNLHVSGVDSFIINKLYPFPHAFMLSFIFYSIHLLFYLIIDLFIHRICQGMSLNVNIFSLTPVEKNFESCKSNGGSTSCLLLC